MACRQETPRAEGVSAGGAPYSPYRAAGRTRFYDDGSLTEVEDRSERLRRRLTPEGVGQVDQALDQLDLASLPDPATPP